MAGIDNCSHGDTQAGLGSLVVGGRHAGMPGGEIRARAISFS